MKLIFFSMRYEIVLHNLNKFLKYVWKRDPIHEINFYLKLIFFNIFELF